MNKKPFLTDVKTLRKRARQHIEEGAVTATYRGSAAAAVKILNDALATEIVCVLRYKRHYFMAKGIHAAPVAAEFLEHANDEQAHADRIAERIVQLGGSPNLSPEGLLTRSHTEYVEAKDSLVEMIKENLVAERIAIDSYREIARILCAIRFDDPKNDRRDSGRGRGARRRPGRLAQGAAEEWRQLGNPPHDPFASPGLGRFGGGARMRMLLVRPCGCQ